MTAPRRIVMAGETWGEVSPTSYWSLDGRMFLRRDFRFMADHYRDLTGRIWEGGEGIEIISGEASR